MPQSTKSRHRPQGTSSFALHALSAAVFIVASMAVNAESPRPTTVSPRATAGDDALKPVAALPAAAPAAPVVPLRRVSLVKPKTENWVDEIEAHGNIMPWQEARIGTEIGGLRLVSVLANVGDVVKKGQVLAQLNTAPVEADVDAAKAQLMEAQAALAQAVATLERARRLVASGGVSQQELTLYETQKQTAEARINAAKAQVRTQQLRLEFATLVAPDDGVISSRLAAEGAIVSAGSELFRLIRKGRLEWCAEVKGETLMKLSVGQEVAVKIPLGPEIKGRVRQIAPTIDLATRNGLVYVELPQDTKLMAGLSVSGTLVMGKRKALIVPATAVLNDSGAARVFKVGSDARLESVDVQVGRTKGDWVEIASGLDGQTLVVARDVELLKAGDTVNVQEPDEPQKVSVAPLESGISAQ